jgi:DNA-binding transcriptional ArsR family regulator
MIITDQTEEVVQKLSKFFDVLRDPMRLEIALLLFRKNLPLSFSEIKTSLGNKYSAPGLSYHIKALERANIIVNERKLDTSSGKARTSFYELTKEGKLVVEALLELAEGPNS